jgi:hypothetical protein
VAEVVTLLDKQPAFVAGSAVAAQVYDLPAAYADVDVFVPTEQVLIDLSRFLMDSGYTAVDRSARIRERWLRYGLKKWATNSLKYESPSGVEVNLVYKTMGGHPTNSLAAVLETFDFGLLSVGYDLEHSTFRDMRSFNFPTIPLGDPLPLMHAKRLAWRQGYFSEYNGMRQAYRYAKYCEYGHDMSQVQDDLVVGYQMGALYYRNAPFKDKVLLADIYSALADKVAVNDVPELLAAYKLIDFTDPLDDIMAALF